MKRMLLVFLLFLLVAPMSSQADWRWPSPHYHLGKLRNRCDSTECIRVARHRRQRHLEVRILHYNKRKLKEWKLWTARYIPDCTWFGESGRGKKYAKARYVMPNAGGSGAYGKFQFKPATYFSSGQYDDWSPLDQEIAARREYWKHDTGPWANC